MTTEPDAAADATAQLAAAKLLIAREILDSQRSPLAIGEIVLRPHQRRAVTRIATLLAQHGGALLADPTGVGKTYIALAAARDVERLLIICPAALRESWRRALARAGRTADVVSVERLSRGAPAERGSPELVVIDESHHLRNPSTKRYATAASLSDRARVLLVSATPVQNRRDDLAAQLALFLGDAAYAMTDLELARLVVRRDGDEATATLPELVGPAWVTLPIHDDVLDDIVALPAAVPLADEGDAHALLRYSLLRQWSSSRAALIAGLRGRLARGVALIAALESGRRPTRQELAAWSHTDDAVQLAIPELLVTSGADSTDDRALLASVERHVSAVRALLDRLRGTPDPDASRVEALRELRRRHRCARIIAFSQYGETVRAISRLLMGREPGVAALTARGGRVAGGRIAREQVLAQLAPNAPRVSPAEQIDLLVTTDVSSEGLDLQLASVVVHLDLPWNPARLEQRVGRVRRLGARHERVYVYALAPPAAAEHVLEVEARLRAKLRVAARLVGIGASSLPGPEPTEGGATPARASEVYALLERWRDPAASALPNGDGIVLAAVRATASGYLALLADGNDRLLLADVGAGATVDPSVVHRAARLAEGVASMPSAQDVAVAAAAVSASWSRHVARSEIRRSSADGARVRARVAARISALLAAAPRHTRPALVARASLARGTLRASFGIAAERELAALADASVADEEWLRRIAELGARRAGRASQRECRILALIVLQKEGA